MKCTAQLICVCVFAYAGCWFSDAAAHIILCINIKNEHGEIGVECLCCLHLMLVFAEEYISSMPDKGPSRYASLGHHVQHQGIT